MEKFLEHHNGNNEIERSANYEGNDTVLFHVRLQNHEIKKQLVDLIYEYYETIDPPSRYFVGDEMKEVDVSEWKRPSKTKEQIERELDERMEKVFSSTKLIYDEDFQSFSSGEGDEATVSVNSRNEATNEKWTAKQLSIIEAHEKGHSIRSFPEAGNSFRSKIQSGFDFSAIDIHITDEMQETFTKNYEREELMEKDEILQKAVEYYSKPEELIERMAQLRNYFGMKGSEEFTKAHLDYAKDHYLSDTGMGIQMQPFLDAITADTEDQFLVLINTLGI
jgi:hypothetical protein